MTEKTQEQRIADAAKWLMESDVLMTYTTARCYAEGILDAADAPVQAKWPTDESIMKFYVAWAERSDDFTEDMREAFREAFLTDPIIQAAVAYRDVANRHAHWEADLATAKALIEAVNEAGL